MQSNEKPVVSRAQMKVVWIVVGIVTLAGAWGLTPWEAIEAALAGEGADVVAFVAGFTLPLVVGSAASVGLLLWLRASGEGINVGHGTLVGIILIAAGLLAHYLGLGLAPDLTGGTYYGPPYIALPLMALTAYFNAYGVGLALAAMSIGAAIALHVDSWRTDPGSIAGDAASLITPQ